MNKENCRHTYDWGDHCKGWVYVESPALSVKQELMPAQATERMHYHKYATQFFFVLTGTALFDIDGKRIEISAGEGIEIKPGQRHRIANSGDAGLEFILCSQPSTKNDRIDI